MTAEQFIKSHFKGIEKETWFPAMVVFSEEYAEYKATDFLKWLERTNTINNSGVPPNILFKMYKNQNKEEQK